MITVDSFPEDNHRSDFAPLELLSFNFSIIILTKVLASMYKKFKLINLFKCLVQKINTYFGHILIIVCSFTALYSICLTFFMFISFLESVKAKCVFCSIEIQYYLSLLINSCFDQFRLSLCSWVLIKVALRSSFLENRSSLIIFDYILICKLCPSVNTTLLAKIFFAHLRLK